jgi:rhodanese-related sulfurtransferase
MHRRQLLTALAAALAFGPWAASAKEEGFSLMPMAEVEKLMARKAIAVYDANVPELWEKNHLPGAVHIVGKDLARILPADRGASVVFYCSGPK